MCAIAVALRSDRGLEPLPQVVCIEVVAIAVALRSDRGLEPLDIFAAPPDIEVELRSLFGAIEDWNFA